MVIILAVFIILALYDLPRFIRKKEPVKVFVVYVFLMAASLAVSLLLAAGKRPASPARWIEWILKMIGVVK
ncbi:MAG: hypothetical protein QHH06_14345 [Clostridiales bacterium]|nr:hypothetical protein [Eubacteriales bacterium]MDH7567623.1 hypothetical protein [Clostridiales bacterium]